MGYPQIEEYEDCEGLAIASVSPGVKALQGQVPSHKDRKLLHREVRDALEENAFEGVAVMNELRVASDNQLSPRRLIGALKRDHYLAGVPISLVDPKYKGALHVEMFFDSAGSVTISGGVPDATYQAYLEARIWTSPGVKRVINLTNPISRKRKEPDLKTVMTHILETDPNVPSDVPMQIDVHVGEGNRLSLEGNLKNADCLRRVERDAWALPQVNDVQNLIEVTTH